VRDPSGGDARRGGLRIAVISQKSPPVHGATLMTERLLISLADAGYPVRLIDRRFSRSVDEIGAPSARKFFAVLGLIARTLRTALGWRPSATIFFATTRPGSFVVDWALSEVLRLSRGRVILYLHSVGFSGFEARGGVWRWMVKRVFSSRRVEVVCLGASLTKDIPARIPRDRIVIIPNTPADLPADLAADPVAVSSSPVDPRVLYLSNFIEGKGADVFARVVGLLRRVHPSATFAMAGNPGDPAMAARVSAELEAADAESVVDLLGPVSGAGKWHAVGSATCLAFTSQLWEAQPLTIIEAFACGVPVVAFRAGGIPDLIVDGVNGFLVDAGDIAGFAERVGLLCSDPVVRRRMAEAARLSFRERYSAQAFAGAWDALLIQGAP
jgi:glycosyltransferase involved in cell wall biosynthesis